MPDVLPVEDKELWEEVMNSMEAQNLATNNWRAIHFPHWGPPSPITDRDRAFTFQMAWRKKIFGKDYPLEAWDDYRTVAPASLTLQRYNKLVASNSCHPPCWERLSVVMVHQAIYRRRFWSKKSLVRLLQNLVRQVHRQLVFENTNKFPKESRQYAFPDNCRTDFFADCMALQEKIDNVTVVPNMRIIPKATLFPKLEYLFVRMKQSLERGDVFVDPDKQTEPHEFLQYWTNKARDMEFLPSSWFTWHNEEFDEFFEYPWINSRNLGYAQIELVNDNMQT